MTFKFLSKASKHIVISNKRSPTDSAKSAHRKSIHQRTAQVQVSNKVLGIQEFASYVNT